MESKMRCSMPASMPVAGKKIKRWPDRENSYVSSNAKGKPQSISASRSPLLRPPFEFFHPADATMEVPASITIPIAAPPPSLSTMLRRKVVVDDGDDEG